MARKFLYIIAVIVVLLIAALLAMRLWSEQLTDFAFVPTGEFTPQPALASDAYNDPAMWISYPGLGDKAPADWLPEGFAASGRPLGAAVFFVHPTSFFEKDRWNAPLGDTKSRELALTFVQGMASPFNASRELWAPRYRQATFGAFLTDAPPAASALDLAYGDISRAFDHFLGAIPADEPIVLVGHSQGAYLLRRLIQERIAGKPLAKRIAAAYLPGWPLSLTHDLPAMGLPPCTAPDEAGCVMSWVSFAEPAEPGMFLKGYARRPGLDGQPVGGTDFLCTDPLTGSEGGSAPARADLGTLVPDLKAKTGGLVPGMVPARCAKTGLLLIGDPPEMGPYVLPGNNYHVYDIPLFWRNLREDVARRVQAWRAK